MKRHVLLISSVLVTGLGYADQSSKIQAELEASISNYMCTLSAVSQSRVCYVRSKLGMVIMEARDRGKLLSDLAANSSPEISAVIYDAYYSNVAPEDWADKNFQDCTETIIKAAMSDD